jgi:hypothetical protein
MKKLSLLTLIVIMLAGCKKEQSNITYPSGTRFNIKNVSLKNLALPNSDGVMIVPENPFIIDDVWPGETSTIKFYTCHSTNGNSYKMPETNMDIISIAPDTSNQ